MENLRKAIIFDKDETLMTTEFGKNGGDSVTLRPDIDDLIEKLLEAKKHGVEIVLCTDASEIGVERFFLLKPEFEKVFDRVITREDYMDIQAKFPVDTPEYEALCTGSQKTGVLLEYDSVLFIDDQAEHGKGLIYTYNAVQGLKTDISYFNVGRYELPDSNSMFRFIEASRIDPNMRELFNEYLKVLRSEKGCKTMCSAIDVFMKKDYEPSLTIIESENGTFDDRLSKSNTSELPIYIDDRYVPIYETWKSICEQKINDIESYMSEYGYDNVARLNTNPYVEYQYFSFDRQQIHERVEDIFGEANEVPKEIINYQKLRGTYIKRYNLYMDEKYAEQERKDKKKDEVTPSQRTLSELSDEELTLLFGDDEDFETDVSESQLAREKIDKKQATLGGLIQENIEITEKLAQAKALEQQYQVLKGSSKSVDMQEKFAGDDLNEK